MVTINNVDASELVEKTAEELKKIEDIKPPLWASFVKTGAHKERPPANKDWWYVRAASILRTISKLGPIGVSKLRTRYGGKRNKGSCAESFYKGSGSIIRKILQQLEKAALIKKVEKSLRKGRIITPKGIKLMDDVTKKIGGNKPIEKKPELKAVEPEKKDLKLKTEELVKKTKEFAEGKISTARELVEEAKKKSPPTSKEALKEVSKETKNG